MELKLWDGQKQNILLFFSGDYLFFCLSSTEVFASKGGFAVNDIWGQIEAEDDLADVVLSSLLAWSDLSNVSDGTSHQCDNPPRRLRLCDSKF